MIQRHSEISKRPLGADLDWNPVPRSCANRQYAQAVAQQRSPYVVREINADQKSKGWSVDHPLLAERTPFDRELLIRLHVQEHRFIEPPDEEHDLARLPLSGVVQSHLEFFDRTHFLTVNLLDDVPYLHSGNGRQATL